VKIAYDGEHDEHNPEPFQSNLTYLELIIMKLIIIIIIDIKNKKLQNTEARYYHIIIEIYITPKT
jgi:hypothetical protein